MMTQTTPCQCPSHAGSDAVQVYACTRCGSSDGCECQHRGVFTGKTVAVAWGWMCADAAAYLARRNRPR
jgi:hypothetical protein